METKINVIVFWTKLLPIKDIIRISRIKQIKIKGSRVLGFKGSSVYSRKGIKFQSPTPIAVPSVFSLSTFGLSF
jgi:hypothetical protein